MIDQLLGLTCWRLPRFVRSEKAIVPFGVLGLADSSVHESFAILVSRSLRLIGSGTSNVGLRSCFRDSRLSAIILAYSRSNSASSSGSTSSSCRVTTIDSSSESVPGAEGAASPFVSTY